MLRLLSCRALGSSSISSGVCTSAMTDLPTPMTDTKPNSLQTLFHASAWARWPRQAARLTRSCTVKSWSCEPSLGLLSQVLVLQVKSWSCVRSCKKERALWPLPSQVRSRPSLDEGLRSSCSFPLNKFRSLASGHVASCGRMPTCGRMPARACATFMASTSDLFRKQCF